MKALNKIFSIGNHPAQHAHSLFSFVTNPVTTARHFRRCQENCFQQMFWEGTMRVLSPISFGLGGSLLLRAQYLSGALFVIVSGLLFLLSRFACHVYTYEDFVKRAHANEQVTFTKIRELFDMAGIPTTDLGHGLTAVDVTSLMPGQQRPDEDPIDQLIRESNALAQKNKKNNGGTPMS